MLRHIVLFLACLSGTANAVELWNGAEAGMTIEQVQAVIPEASPTPEYKAGSDGSRIGLRADGPTLSGHQFVADFIFVDGKLTFVNLRTKEDVAVLAIRELFDAVKEALLVKYGEPLEVEYVFKGSADFKATFRGQGTLISLYGVSIGSQQGRVVVRYSAPEGVESL